MYEFQWVVRFLLQEYASRDLGRQLSAIRFLLRAGGKHALLPEEVPVKHMFGKKYTHCELNADCNASFSSVVTAATRLLGFSDNGFKCPKK